MKELTPYRFDHDRHAWCEAEPGSGSGAAATTLQVVTQNVWFDPYEQIQRWYGLLEEIKECRADLIAFQEVTRPFHELVCETRWIREGYTISDRDGDTYDRYGVMLLSRVPLSRLTLHDMASQMGRRLLVAEIASEPGGDSMAVATIHLESLRPSAPYREIQFDQCVRILDEFDHAVLMGDMNFCASWADENRRIPANYIDIWPRLHPGDPGYTVDTAANPMVHLFTQAPKKVRYDRIFLHSANDTWRPESIKRLGTQPVGDDLLIYPSDHFGLAATLCAQGHDDPSTGS